MHTNLQYEQKHKDHGEKVEDSGGTTILMGPAASVQIFPHSVAFAAVQLPVYQDLGGVHQELDFSATGGIKLDW